MPTSPESPLDALFGGISAEQLIAEEQESQDPEPLAPSVLGKRTSPSKDIDSDDEGNGESPSPGGETSPSSSSTAHPNPATLQIGQTMRRMAKRLRFSNENVSLVEQFTQVGVINPLLEAGD